MATRAAVCGLLLKKRYFKNQHSLMESQSVSDVFAAAVPL